MPHVVLLGDSIFDNKAYTAGGPDVVTQLQGIVPSGWRATLCAIDGATTEGFSRQVAAIPAGRRVLSVTICTIYNGNFPDRDFQRLASTALCIFMMRSSASRSRTRSHSSICGSCATSRVTMRIPSSRHRTVARRSPGP